MFTYYTPQGKPLRCFDCDSLDLMDTVTSYDVGGIAESIQVECTHCGIIVGYLDNAIWDKTYMQQATMYLSKKHEFNEPYYFADKETFIEMMNHLHHTPTEVVNLMSEALSKFSIQADNEILDFYNLCNVPMPEAYYLEFQDSKFNQHTHARELHLFDEYDEYDDVPDVDLEMNRPLID